VKARSDYYHASELCIGKSLSEKLLVDKNPSLTLTLPSLARIFPEIKILLVLRDPRDVCLSCFMQPFVPIQQVNSSYLSLDTTVEEYGELMKMWLMVKPYLKSPFLEIRYEAMIDDLELVARNVLNFLQVPWHAGVLNYDQHATQKVVRSPTYVDVTQKLFTRAKGRWQNYEKFMAPHLEKLDPFLKAFGYD
jgi:Sulfotransferase domain.